MQIITFINKITSILFLNSFYKYKIFKIHFFYIFCKVFIIFNYYPPIILINFLLILLVHYFIIMLYKLKSTNLKLKNIFLEYLKIYTLFCNDIIVLLY